MAQPKFILTNTGHLRLGMVNLHKDLLQPGEDCLGGGFYEFDFVSNRLLLSGRSYDFGSPKWHWVDSIRIPSVYAGLQILYSPDHSFDSPVNLADFHLQFCD